MKFIDEALAMQCATNSDLEALLDRCFGEWRADPKTGDFAQAYEHLGMTIDEYALWVECGLTLGQIVARHRHGDCVIVDRTCDKCGVRFPISNYKQCVRCRNEAILPRGLLRAWNHGVK